MMLELIIYIFFLSIVGIAIIFQFFNYILQRIFDLPHIPNDKQPEDFNLNASNILIPLPHHKKIQLWDLNPKNPAPIILGVHGWANSASRLLYLGSALTSNWRVFLLNTRNHGESSDEKYITLLQYSEDLITAIDYITTELNCSQKICLLGHSLGGAAALYTATIDNRVKGVISISTFADLEKMITTGFLRKRMPTSIASSMIKYIEFRVGKRLRHLSPLYTVGKFTGPVLLLHGTKDKTIPFAELNQIMKSAKRPNVFKSAISGQTHSSIMDVPDTVLEIEKFLKKYFAD